jgi:hypothetical protein
MRKLAVAVAVALALALAAAACSSDKEAAPAPTTTTVLGRDPTAPTAATVAASQNPTFLKLVADLKRHGYSVRFGKSEPDPIIPKIRMWDGSINGVSTFIDVCQTDEACNAKLEALDGFGSIAVFSPTARWIINPESALTDDATFAKSEKLANEIAKALYDDWQGTVRISVPRR